MTSTEDQRYSGFFHSRNHFRNGKSGLNITANRIQKQNLVNCRNVEPALTEGAEVGYVKRLIEQSGK